MYSAHTARVLQALERETGAVLCVIESYRAGGFTVCVCVCVCVCVYIYMCVCVCEREKEREREKCILLRSSIQLQYFAGCFVKKLPVDCAMHRNIVRN